MNKLAEASYKVVENVLNSRNAIIHQATEMCGVMLETCNLKASMYNNNVKRKIEFLGSELESAMKYLDNPSAVYYLRLMETEDVQAKLAEIKASLESLTESDLEFASIAPIVSKAKLSAEEAENALYEDLNNLDRKAKDIKYDIINTWASHFYCKGVKDSQLILMKKMHELRAAASEPVRQENSDGRKGVKALTNAQQVLMIGLLNDVYKINKSQDKKSLNDFIHALTEKTEKTIENYSRLYERSGHIQSKKKQNLEDFKAVRPFFEKLDQVKVLNIIDEKIKYFNSLKE
ncbi:hypothetical protein [Pontibacter anaerobius]|uniref:CHAD domain-containing protein n=1 Tax=Pontibacter anaerobius TaxID=2993940 RepID=A0ABT3RK47_9BACT|nr:hypothetical protein [Pontibacter anaerobius]MCX2741987.1 hypothetical protein [Pontibacter anaerobius]